MKFSRIFEGVRNIGIISVLGAIGYFSWFWLQLNNVVYFGNPFTVSIVVQKMFAHLPFVYNIMVMSIVLAITGEVGRVATSDPKGSGRTVVGE